MSEYEISDAKLKAFQLLAFDYDGTLALDGEVPAPTLAALSAARTRNYKLLLVTGRQLDNLLAVCPHVSLFDLIVAEDGALLYSPATRDITLQASPPDETFINELKRQGIPFSNGRIIVSTSVMYESLVARVAQRLDCSLHITRNKGSAMFLPKGIDKGSGFRAALASLGLPTSAAVAFGDAENDLAFMRLSGFSVAVANALEAVKQQAHIVMDEPAGHGVAAFMSTYLFI